MNDQQIIKICKEIVKLKQLVKCPICLDTIQKCAELSCGHKLCTKCQTTLKKNNTSITCPVCKTTSTRRSHLNKDLWADRLGSFVHEISNKMEEAKGCTIEEIVHNEKKIEKKVKNSPKVFERKPEKKTSQSGSDVLSVTKIDLTTKDHGIFTDEPSTSKIDAFDKLLKNSQDLVNKKGTRKTYNPRKKKRHGNDDGKILDFLNSDTKNNVLQWLNDNKNKFDRLTQTQRDSEPETPPISLTSASQKKHNKTKPLDIHIKRKARNRSLDLKPEKLKEEKLHHSDLGLTENYDIEEESQDILKKAEENALLRIIQDSYLDKLEKGIENKAKDTSSSMTSKCDTTEKKKESNDKSCHNTQSSWVRVGNILKKKGKCPKTLNIKLEPSQNKTKTQGKILKVTLLKNPIIEITDNLAALQDTTVEVKNTSNISMNEESEQKEGPSNQHKNQVIELQNSLQECNKENNEGLAIQNQKINVISNIMLDASSYLNNTNQEEKIPIFKEVTTNKSESDDDPYELPTQTFPNEDFEKPFEENKSPTLDRSNFELNSFEDVMINLKYNLETYLEYLNNGQHLGKRHMECILRYLEKLNSLHEVVQSKALTAACGVDQSIQVEPSLCHAHVQTETLKFCNAEVQTTDVTDLPQEIEAEPNVTLQAKTRAGELKTIKKTQSDEFAGTLNFVFETQDIIKNQDKKATQKKSQKLANLVGKMNSQNKNDKENTTDQNDALLVKETPEELICSLKSDCATKDKTNKRVFSDSDSPEIDRTKRKCHRFIRDDLSIEFDATAKTKTQKLAFSPGLSLESDEENEEYLNDILKRYGGQKSFDDILSSKPADKIDKTLNNVQSEVKEQPKKLLTFPNSLDDDNIFNDENLSKLDTEIRLHTRNGESETSDVIGKTESEDCLNEKHNMLKCFDSALSNVEKTANFEGTSNNIKSLSFNRTISDVIPETEFMEPPLKKPKRKNSALGKDKLCEKLTYNLKDEKTSAITNPASKATFCPELEDGVDFANIERDLFSDEDIVETTPEKKEKLAEKRTQNLVATNLFSISGDIREEFAKDFDLNFISLDPPPGFEDEKIEDEVPSSGDITIINIKPREEQENDLVTPKKSSQENMYQINIGPITPLDIKMHKVPHSTPRTQQNTEHQTLGLSPIALEGKKLFQKASPSDSLIIKSQETAPRCNILTSDPKQRSIMNYITSEVPSSPVHKPKPSISCTRLTKEQIQSISLLTNRKLAIYHPKFNNSVTHMIVAVDEKRRIRDYTIKYVAAVASGVWVLSFDWVKECLKKNAIVPEEPYEVLDDEGNPGPRTARLNKGENLLFKDYWFYCVRPLYSLSVDEIEDVIAKLGGITVRNLESLNKSGGKVKLVITEGSSTQDFEVYAKWLEKYKVASVDIEWLSKCIGRYRVLSIRPYVWCNNTLDNLNYPSYLTAITSTCASREQ